MSFPNHSVIEMECFWEWSSFDINFSWFAIQKTFIYPQISFAWLDGFSGFEVLWVVSRLSVIIQIHQASLMPARFCYIEFGVIKYLSNPFRGKSCVGPPLAAKNLLFLADAHQFEKLAVRSTSMIFGFSCRPSTKAEREIFKVKLVLTLPNTSWKTFFNKLGNNKSE